MNHARKHDYVRVNVACVATRLSNRVTDVREWVWVQRWHEGNTRHDVQPQLKVVEISNIGIAE